MRSAPGAPTSRSWAPEPPMRDGPVRRVVKALALGAYYANRAPSLLWRRLRRRDAWRLGGECRRCAACCEQPAIQSNLLVWHMPRLRALFLKWQERVNGFVLVGTVPDERLF